jgi:hypothetical protein
MESTTVEPKFTAQSFYDAVCAHLVAQGKRCYQAGVGCLYRGPEGLKCAIGAVIPDDIYTPEMDRNDGFTALGLYTDFPEVQPYIPNMDLAISLQHVHDIPDTWDTHYGGLSKQGKDSLEGIAKRFKLMPYAFMLLLVVLATGCGGHVKPHVTPQYPVTMMADSPDFTSGPAVAVPEEK